jgi:transposase
VPETAEELAGMPGRWQLERAQVGAETVVSFGGRVLFRIAAGDRGMRNLAMVALTQAGIASTVVADLFGVSREHLSRLRGRVAEDGSAALLPRRGRPPKLSEAQVARCHAMADEGANGVEIAIALDVSAATISRLLARRPRPEPERLGLGDHDGTDAAPSPGAPPAPTPESPVVDADDDATASAPGQLERIGEGEVACRYAGAMLLHPFLDTLGADDVVGAMASGPSRRYDTTGLFLSATFGFALGISSLEGAKHLCRADAGALVGIHRFPDLATLRPRLGTLADGVDPLAVQVAFAKALLGADERPPEVFFCDDHFVAYTGAAPVAKGYNIRRHLAEPGRDDTFVTDVNWRAICFASGEPRGLTKSLPEVLAQLIEICGGRKILLGFDRGGSYPVLFAKLAAEGVGFLTYRRAPLVAPGVAPRRSWVKVNGRRIGYRVADEMVTLDGVGAVRQLSVYDAGKVVFQVLTSDTAATAAYLCHMLRCRWRIENTFKYLEDHHGIHWLSDYTMELRPDPSMIANPERAAARAGLKTAGAALESAERALGKQTASPSRPIEDHLAAVRSLRDDVAMAADDLAEAKAALSGVPAELPATDLDPDAKRATPRLARRALQMVCRLLAYNAELDLARRLNAYLADPDEYRTITRHLLHLGGRIAFGPRTVTVTLDRPDVLRVAGALGLLIEEFNANPARIPGDRRPLNYRLATA